MNQDNLDPVIGENAGTPSVSQTETITPEQTSDVNSQSASANLSPEEAAWNELKGGTQDRIKQILRERDEERARAERIEGFYKNQQPYQAPMQQTSFTNEAPEVADAVQKLSNIGIATDTKVDQKIDQRIGNLIYSFELEKLENRYDGKNGLPKFERTEYEDYVNKNPYLRNYAPEDVYGKMYSEEILEAKARSLGDKTGQSSTSSLRPTTTVVRENELTPEFIEQRLKQADGRKWYSENQTRINAAIATAHSSRE